MSLLEVSAWTGVLASMLLTYRIASSWRVTSALTKAVAITLLAVILIQAYGSSQAILHSPHAALQTNVVAMIFVGRLLVVAMCVAWPWRD